MSQHRWPSSSGSYEPLTYFRGVALDVTTLITAIHVGCMLVIAVLLTLQKGAFLEALVFQTTFLADRQPWTLFTYAFYHDIRSESLFFALQMLMFFWFGREVERFIGRNAFLWFYALLCLLPPMAMSALSLVVPLGSTGPISGSMIIHLGVFVGFTVIYPNTQLLFGILAKWMAVVFLGIYTLVYLAGHAWFTLTYLWLTMAVAWSMLRMAGVGGGFGWWNAYESWRIERSERKVEARRVRRRQKKEEEEKSVDQILEKISQSGVGSLTQREKEILERTRQQLVQRDSGRNS